MAKYCSSCGQLLEDGMQFCFNCGAPHGDAALQKVAYKRQLRNSRADEYWPMKWYYFVIYFQLFASCVLSIFGGIMFLTGALYRGYSKFIYSYFSGLQALDVIVGICSFGLAGYALYVRSRLRNYKENGPTCYLIFLVANFVFSLLYYIIAMVILDSFIIPSFRTIVNLAWDVAMIVGSKAYFDKRYHMFVY